MSYQQISVSREMLARVIGDTNNDLATLAMQFASEVDAALEDANSRAREWQQKAEVLHTALGIVRDDARGIQRYAVDRANRANAGTIDYACAHAYAEALADVVAILPAAVPL